MSFKSCILALFCASCASQSIQQKNIVPLALPGFSVANHISEVECFMPQIERRLSRTIYFSYAKATLSKDSVRTLEELMAELEKRPWYVRLGSGIVAGQTDSSGNSQVNRRLRKARGKAAVDYLVSHGFPSSQIDFVDIRYLQFSGEAGVEGDNRTIAGQKMNRRADISIGLLEHMCPEIQK